MLWRNSCAGIKGTEPPWPARPRKGIANNDRRRTDAPSTPPSASSHRPPEHDTTASALRGIDYVSDVVIMSRPSQLARPALRCQPADTAKPSSQRK
jgi:hypothetical protein